MLSMATIALFQATSAAFEETVRVAGSSFSVASELGDTSGGGGEDTNTDLKILADVSLQPVESNLADSVNGPNFTLIDQNWTDDYMVKLHNAGSFELEIISLVEYVNDPNTLRDDIFVAVIEWNDSDSDGVLDAGEEGVTYGNDSILRWRNDTFNLGVLSPGETQGYVLRFNGSGITETNLNQEAVYDFVFTGVEVE